MMSVMMALDGVNPSSGCVERSASLASLVEEAPLGICIRHSPSKLLDDGCGLFQWIYWVA